MKRIIQTWNKTNLIKRIGIGMVTGGLLGLLVPNFSGIGLLGELFVGGLKAIAPVLVFALVANALSQHQKDKDSNMKTVIFLYLLGTFTAALVAVLASFLFPIQIELSSTSTEVTPPDGIGQVLSNLLLNLVDNPINALTQANYIGILSWAVVFGIAMRETSKTSKELLKTIAGVTSKIVEWIINLAPFGILGLVFETISDKGIAKSCQLWNFTRPFNRNYALCCLGCESYHRFPFHETESLSPRFKMLTSQWCYSFLYS